MPTDLFNREDPWEWSEDRRHEEFRRFRETEVVGDHCEDCQFDARPVIGRGNLTANLMVVGDYTAPADQKTGKPFSGPAGDLLKEMLSAIELDWEEDCYVTNALLCDGTDEAPKKSSVKACRRNLTRLIDIVSPSVIFCIGKLGFQSLFHESASVTLRDHLGHRPDVPNYPGLEAVVSFNPAYVLRQPEGSRRRNLKKTIWGHLQTVKFLLNEKETESGQEEP